MTNSDIFSGLSRGQFLSKTGNCQTFDNDADGYCRGDGIGSLVIKRLDDAVADNDRILGVILETATNHSANAISITHPHAPTQEVLFKKVMDDAGVDPHSVNYVEMHGTGTQAGDGTEMVSVTNVFAPASRTGTRKKSLHLGSVKANVGHGEAVSGVTAMIKCLLMMQKNGIPPHCGIKKTINQGFPQDLNARNVHIAFKPTPLVSQDGSPRRIFLNNFSAAGGNTALLLEDAPARPTLKEDGRGDWVVGISAKSKSALRANAKNMIHYIKSNSQTRLPDLSYTTTARRIQHNYRIAFSCDTLSKASEILSSKMDDAIEPVPSVSPSITFAYTGQGSHYTGLGQQLYELSRHFRADLKSFDDIACGLGFPSFMSLVKGDVEAKDLSPMIVQVGLTSIQMALTRLWASWGVKPDVVIGHSLGEYAALNAAGVLSVSETIYLVGERARLLQEKCTADSHAMLATKSSTSMLKETFSEYPGVEVACVNGARETVLGGTVHDIDRVAEKLTTQGTKCTKLNVQFAFHSSQVEPILADFEQLAKSVTFNKPLIPVISPLLATVLSEADNINEHYLARHARETVDFSGGLAAAQQLGLINDQTVFVEIGPNPVCLSFIKSELGHEITTAHSLRKGVAPFKTVSESLATLHTTGISIDWNEYHRDFLDCVQMLDLPAYAFDNKNYWIQYTGDWNLHKGQVLGLAALPEAEVPKLSTTTVHRVVSEVVEVDKATVVVESDISRPDLLAAISGHVVNGTALCPSSIYGDMAMTIGEYLYKLLRPETETVHMNVCHMEVFKPFIANDDGGKGQVLRLTATTANIASGRANLTFSSGSGKAELQHAKCHVDFGSGSAWLAEWQRTAYLISGRIDGLKKAATSGNAHRMLRGMAYKLFGAFVEYDTKYRGMEEVILDSPALEATAHIDFQTKESDGNFVCSPYWIDSVCHLAGFIVNANDAVDSSKQVYVSHGWESMRFAEPLQANKTYRSYVKMQPLPGNMIAGDVFIFDGDRIIGMCGALKFQCIPRTLLNTFLPPKGSTPQKAPIAARASPKAIDIKAVKKVAPKAIATSKTGPSVTTQVLDIIASEVGVPVTELADAIDFANMGVDSLMSLSICGRIREELEIDAPASLFVDYPTVGSLKGHLSQYGSPKLADVEVEYSSGSSTPSMEYDDNTSHDGSAETPMSPPGTPGTPGTPSDSESLSMIIRQTISEEMGVDIAELSAADDLSSLGMDSLMSLSILGMLREKAGLSLPADFLVDNQTIKAIETALHIGSPPPKRKSSPKQETVTQAISKTVAPVSPNSTRVKKPVLPERLASSVLLQGSPKTAEKSFWLIPDGGGAPTSYIFLDELSPKLVVWGLTSPFCKTPEEYMCGVVGIATKFIVEIKRRQPKGPYNIGGWSAGGVISFETVRQLIDMGDVVDTLVFIDTPCPLIIEPLPGTLHKFFGSIGLLGEGDGAIEKLPPWLLPHFAASVHALSCYDAVPIPAEKCPKVMAIWCEDGVCKEPEDPRPDPYPYGHAQWLLENRTDFGPNLWEEFLDESKIVTRKMPGNHFSMMKAPFVGKLTEFLREALC
jgi:iterative type I PKS product template protein